MAVTTDGISLTEKTTTPLLLMPGWLFTVQFWLSTAICLKVNPLALMGTPKITAAIEARVNRFFADWMSAPEIYSGSTADVTRRREQLHGALVELIQQSQAPTQTESSEDLAAEVIDAIVP